MLVRDYMTTNVTTLTDDLRLLDAALMIRRTGKRHVPILAAETGKLVGIISDRDISRLAPSILSKQSQEEYNRVFEETPITMAMTKAPITISPDAPIIDAVQILYSKKIGGLLAVEDGELKGILTVSDMLGLLSELLSGSDKSKTMTGGS
ncbi:MAG: domain containing protein [Candidatus Angelobacter sp.]|jgi:acetoin utilization protein AcuB|nr:domain containing protein [Candidatus Angelobacter sp.]